MAKDKKRMRQSIYVNLHQQKAILFTLMLMGKKLLKQCSQTIRQQDTVNKRWCWRQQKDAVYGQDEVKFLRNLVSEIQSEKKELHKLLDQQQRLAYRTNTARRIQAEIKDLKSLNDGTTWWWWKRSDVRQTNRNLKIAPRSHNLNLKSGGVLVNSYN